MFNFNKHFMGNSDHKIHCISSKMCLINNIPKTKLIKTMLRRRVWEKNYWNILSGGKVFWIVFSISTEQI